MRREENSMASGKPATGGGRRPKAALHAWVGALNGLQKLVDAPDTTLPGLLDDLATAYGDRPALMGEGETLSYRDLARVVRRHARWARCQGLAPGEVVCLLMPNRPAYVAAWLGLTRAGCVVALINTSLAGDQLLHCIAAAGSRRLMVDASLLPAIAAVMARLPPDFAVWNHADMETDAGPLDGMPDSEPAMAPPRPADRALLVYTSGTTGWPKAAVVTHARIAEWSFWFAGMMDATPEDRVYDCLPLYHSVGGIVAVGAMLVSGGSVLIRARFSASAFWDDVVEGGCTIFQYIGELCRYLSLTPPHPRERQHRLRLACGNGLSGDVWSVFQERFAIPNILEFYAATEGGVSLYNCEGKAGAIGRVPAFLAHRFPIALVRRDPATDEPLRGADGLCIVCAPGEPGEALGPLSDTPHGRRFDGYTDPEASARKVLHNVFNPGDRWFRSGDLMRKDAAGYYYFVDRLGDTFRWKGENVSTTEVASVLRAWPGVRDALVYGVAIPGHEGRTGMAAIVTDARFNLAGLHAHLVASLPAYARPMFVRLRDALDMTATFKPTKVTLAGEGFARSNDPVWFNDRAAGFVPCDAALLHAIMSGTRRL